MAQNPSNVIPDQLIVVEGGKQLVPAPSSGDSGKVLGVLNSNGDIGWTEDREGMAQQQADWAETDSSKVTFIANKPSGQMAPASTSSDSGKVLKVNAQGAPVWGDVSGVAEFLWSTVTRADVDAAMADGKMPVILDDTFSGEKIYCYLYNTASASPADTLHFASIPVPGSWSVLYHIQSAIIWVLSFNPSGIKSRTSKKVAAEITSDNSITLLDDNGKLKITVANPLPASTSADAGKALVVDSSGKAAWTTPSTVTVDQTYNASSANAQSGTAVAGAVSGIRQVPSSSSGDSGKVLTVNSSGNPTWQTASGGGPQSRCNFLRIYDPNSSTDWDFDTRPTTSGGNDLYVTGTWSLANLFSYYTTDWGWVNGLRDSYTYMLSGIIPARPSNGIVESGEIFISSEQSDPSDPMMTQDYIHYRQPVNAKTILTFDNNGNGNYNAVQFSVVLPPMSINTWDYYSPNTNRGCFIQLIVPSGDSWSITPRTSMTDTYAERMKIFCTAVPVTNFHYYRDP